MSSLCISMVAIKFSSFSQIYHLRYKTINIED